MKFKFKKIIFSLFIMFLSTMIVHAEVPDKIRLNGSPNSLHYINAAQLLPNVVTTDGENDGQNLSLKKTTNNEVVYCVNPDLNLYDGTIDYTKGDKLGNEILYIMQNGYPNNGKTTDSDYFITNLAIWYYMVPDRTNSTKLHNYDFENGKYKGGASNNTYADSPTVASAYSLAMAARNYTPPANTIKVNNNNSNIDMELSSDGNFFVTSNIAVETSNNATTYKVTLSGAPTGTQITTTSDVSKDTFNKGESFKVKVPTNQLTTLSTSFTVTVTVTYNDQAVYKYNPDGQSNKQALAYLVTETSTKPATLTLRITRNTELKISKRIQGTNEVLKGASLTLKKENGEEIRTWNSALLPETFENLEQGNYKLIENSAPEGYIKSTKILTFTIGQNGTISNVVNGSIVDGEIVFYNEKEPVKGQAIISKQDESGKGLAGASLELWGPNGRIHSWVSKTTPETIDNLDPGTYTVKEIKAPDKYVKSKDVTFTVKSDGTVSGTVVIKNYPDEVTTNQKTGGNLSIILIIVSFFALGCSAYLLLKDNKTSAQM